MPSDPRVGLALAALQRPIADFRAAVQGALVQADAFLAAQSDDAGARAARAGAELGPFAAQRIDAGRFAACFPATAAVDGESMCALRHAMRILRTVATVGDGLFVAEVAAGQRLGATIDSALAIAGGALGALIICELVRGGRYKAADHARLLDATEFRAWNRSERRFAPPLVVSVNGADLFAGALLDFADGREKIVLVVHGAAPPAALVRCITPGTFVLQTLDGSGLDRVAGFDGPAIAALMPEGAAVFMHEPTAGREPWQRMTVRHLPPPPTRALGGLSTWHMGEDLKMLADLARTPFAVPGANGGAGAPAMGSTDAVDRIAHWLLDTSGLAPGV